VSINIEGLTPEKEILLSEMCRKMQCGILCVPETHRSNQQNRPNVKRMRLVVEKSHSKYESAIFLHSNINVISTEVTNQDVELLTVDI